MKILTILYFHFIKQNVDLLIMNNPTEKGALCAIIKLGERGQIFSWKTTYGKFQFPGAR